MMTRRQALKTATLATAACAVGPGLQNASSQPAPSGGSSGAGPFSLPTLPYPFDALEPHLDARTMEIHHDKHHAAYVSNLNKAVAEFPELVKKSVEDLVKDLSAIPEKIRAAVRNNGGGHCNHSLFWLMMKKNGGGEPKGELAKSLEGRFGSFSAFKDEFTKAALGQFGSGWAWLTLDGRELRIESTPNQDTPITQGRQPLLGIDVWEHAYYLKYQNRRADYVSTWWNTVNWDYASDLFAKASLGR